MELAVSTIFLIILLLPGFILQTAYSRGFWRWKSPTSVRSLPEQIPIGVVLASILHAFWIGGVFLFGWSINFSAVAMLVLGFYGHNDVHFEDALNALIQNPYKVFWYFCSLYLVSAVLGYLAHWIVRRYALDRRSYFLRFNNPWFYLLTGEIAEFGEEREEYPDIAGVYLTTVVHHTGKDYLYRGLVNDFFFDKTGNLDRVLLTLAIRRDLSDDRKPVEEFEPGKGIERYYNIEGDYFVLRYSEMSTINIDYVFITPAEIKS